MLGALRPSGSGGGSVGTQATLLDSLFSGATAGHYVRKNIAGTSIEYAATAGGGVWGSITGTLSSQTDLNTALGLRLLASNNLSDVPTPATARTNLGVAIGTNVQAFSANLSAIAGLATTSGNFIRANGSTWTSTTLAASDVTSGTLDITRIPTGSSASTVCVGNDARLSDARTPTALSVTNASVATNAAIVASKLDLTSPGAIGSTAANTGRFTTLTSTLAVFPASTAQTLTAASAINPNATTVQVSAASAITLTSTPTITAGSDGQTLRIINTGSFNITLQDAGTLAGSTLWLGQSNVILSPNSAVDLIYNAATSRWINTNGLSSGVPASVALTGTPTAPTPTPGTNNTQIATTAFVANAVAAGGTFTPSNVSITGGAIDGTTIGATTRSSGAFTTLTLTNALGIANGGTGATSASGARTALGLTIGTDVQAFNVNLNTIAGLTPTAGQYLRHNGTSWAASGVAAADLTGTIAVANGGTGSTTAADARTALGVAIGTNVQAFSATLNTIAGLAVTSGNFLRANGTAWTSTALAASDIASGALDIARIPTGTTASTVCAGNDARLSDTRTPTALSVTNASVATNAAIAASKLDLTAPGAIGSTTANTGRFTTLTGTSSLILPASAAQTVAAATTITPNAGTVQITATGAVTLTSVPHVTAGTDGQNLRIINTGSNTITFQDAGTLTGSGVRFAGATSFALAANAVLELTYNAALTAWVTNPVSAGGGGAVASVFGRTGVVAAAAGDYSAAQIAGLGASAAPLVITPSATQTLTAASTINPNAGLIPISAASAITLTSNPQITAGTNGQRVTLVNVGSFGITLFNGNGLILGQNIPLYGGKTITLIYFTAYSSWVLDFLIPESVALTGVPTAPTAVYGTNTTQLATCAFVETATASRFIEAARVSAQTFSVSTAGQSFTVIFSTEYNDFASQYNTATGQVTIGTGHAGVYQIATAVTLDLISASTRVILGIYKSGTERRVFDQTFAAGSYPATFGSVCLNCAVGNTIDIRLTLLTTGTFSTFPDGNLNYLNIARVA